jgi:CBS domain-containing protein
MNIGKLGRRNVVTVREFDDLTQAAQLMRDKHVGYLVVVAPSPAENALRPIGVLTDRDIVVAVVGRDINPRELRVGDVMTREPVVIGEGKSVSAALSEMRRIGVRRLPVVGGLGQLVAVVSLDDILEHVAGEMLEVAGSLRNEQLIESALRP